MKKGLLVALGIGVPVLIGWGVVQLISRDMSQPNRELFTEMSESFAAESQAISDALPGKHVQQTPPEGTIFRGQLAPGMGWGEESAALEFLATAESAKTISAPAPLDEADLLATRALGAKRYAKYCLSCHGDTGQGNAALADAGFPKPPDIVGGRATTLADGELYLIILKGQGKMQPMGGRVPANDIWAIIQRLREMQGKGGGQ